MFKLERVEISGFKSFFDKVDLAFPGSVTAVVGPNGCGKSNISDAVSWALGEQSAKTLRGERMDDVIFNGSSKRRPLGMAEVILTLSTRRRRSGQPPVEGNGNGNGHRSDDAGTPAESPQGQSEQGEGQGQGESETLRIGRRVYREGTGEYFLNDKQVRLKDIQDRLLGTGLGVRAYSVIEQGRIDQVLSTKPQDRRRLIEEASGITRYKLKKRLAESKLEETRGNLLRISDIISEIEKNVASLKRQASRAARYQEQFESWKRKKAALARTRHDVLLSSVGQAERVRDERRDQEAQAAAALGRAESELASARLAASELQSERDRLRDAVNALENAIQRDDTLLEGNRRAAGDLADRRASLEREGREVAAEQTRSQMELNELEERLERAVVEARARSLAREEADAKAAAAVAALSALEHALESAREGLLAAAGDRVAARNARHEVDLEASRAAASLSRLNEAHTRTSAELGLRQIELERAREEQQHLAGQAAAARGETEAWEAELARLAGALSEAEVAREAARETLSVSEHRLGALSEIWQSRQGSLQAVRGALSAAGISEGGSLADRLRPASGWEEAVDLLLGDDLEAVLSSGDPAAAVAASSGLASASFVRTDWKGENETGTGAIAMIAPGARGGWEVALENFASLSPAERAALPPVSLVDDLPTALSLASSFPSATFVTRNRELVRGSLVRVVHTLPEASGLFALRRDIDRLEIDSARARESVAALDRALEDLRQSRHDCEAGMPSRREREREAAAHLSAFVARFEERRAEGDRLVRERETLEAEARSLAIELERLASTKAAFEADERAHAEGEGLIRERTEKLATALPESRSFATAAGEELAHRRTEAEVAAERRRALETAREKLIEMRGALDRRVGDAFEETRRLSERAEELANEQAQARLRQTENLQSREARAVELEAAAAASLEGGARVTAAEEATKRERGSLDAAREARFESEVSETRVRADLDHLIAQATEEFGAAPATLEAPEDRSAQAMAELEAEVASLAASLERLGPVNVLALEEHRESSERLTFLTAQRDDLLKSIAELQDSIRKINATSSERFRHAFESVNENFKAMFVRLFQGGSAEMRLLDENDLLESGVEIVAQPPGKRNQSIQLLSGGEKALTAIALLMAIFRYKPSPFCILDEVDAPLDEANIDRFTRLLRDMTEDTQFIAITHNKRTMETADVMYGVTMEEPGCSKIVSVRFD